MDERKGIQVHLLCLSTEYHSKLNPKSKKKSKNSKQIDRISKKKEGKEKKVLGFTCIKERRDCYIEMVIQKLTRCVLPREVH